MRGRYDSCLGPLPEEMRPLLRSRLFARVLVTIGAVLSLVVAGGVVGALVRSDGPPRAATSIGVRRAGLAGSTSTSTLPPTTTSTIPPLQQPAPTLLPDLPGGSLGPGAQGDVVRAYQQRFVDLHFDPGPVDGSYGQAMTYAVQALEKIVGLPRTGRVGQFERHVLMTFQYPAPLQPNGEPNRTEVDVTKQVLTLYQGHQVRLITTTSTGAGERYCYDTPRDNPTTHVCEYANTPSGRFAYTRFVQGWDRSPLGQLYNPFYFNGGIAVHGYQSVPPQPASHGCVRIPMHIAEYFHTLVNRGDPVYVFGGKPAQIISSTPLAPATTAPPATAPPAPATPAPTPAAPSAPATQPAAPPPPSPAPPTSAAPHP